MSIYTLDELRAKVPEAVRAYNERAAEPDRIDKVSLFGSYAEGRASESSDIDLLVTFASSVVSLFTLAKVLSSLEESLGVPVDVVQDPLPEESLLMIGAVIPLYA